MFVDYKIEDTRPFIRVDSDMLQYPKCVLTERIYEEEKGERPNAKEDMRIELYLRN